MAKILNGKTAFVTAAGDGIGKQIAISLAGNGARVIATSRSGEKLFGLTEQGVLAVHEVNVVDANSLFHLAQEYRDVDVLVNCAGIAQENTVLSCLHSELAKAIDTNVVGTINAIQAFLPCMLENGGGSIINIASIISSLKGAPDRFSYGLTKGAVIGLTKSVSNDFAARGIRCNAICPGTIETPSMSARINQSADPEEARKKFSARHPVGRLGRPEDVAAMAVHLASDSSGFITGQTIILDGGWTA